MIGSHLIKSWSSTQAVISLSSGEAEFYGVVKASGIGLGYQALLEDLGWKVDLRVWTDSTATIGICGRAGLGKLRHIDTRALWIQQRVKDASVELRKIKGEVNPADLFTKHLPSGQKIVDLLALVNCQPSGGRPSSAPELKTQSSSSTRPTAVLNIHSSESETPVAAHSNRSCFMNYGGRVFPCVEYEGIQVPEAYDHDPEILPHQHENMEELFPRAFVPHAADADEVMTEIDSLEQRGEQLGRSGAAPSAAPQTPETSTQPLVLCVKVGALTPQATPAACVKLRGEALTLQITPVACVKL